MPSKTKFYIVAAEALPEIFIKVAEAKRMMQTGEADTVGAATRMVGISRSGRTPGTGPVRHCASPARRVPP